MRIAERIDRARAAFIDKHGGEIGGCPKTYNGLPIMVRWGEIKMAGITP